MKKKFALIGICVFLFVACNEDDKKYYGEPCPPFGGAENMLSTNKWDAEAGYCELRYLCHEKKDGFQCEMGSECDVSQVKCGSKCVDPLTNRDFCGASGDCTQESGEDSKGIKCKDNELCTGGACFEECPIDKVFCDGRCIDPMTDLLFCGATGNQRTCGLYSECVQGEICKSGSCICDVGLVFCKDKCIDPKNDSEYCGAGECARGELGARCAPNSQTCVEGVCTTIQCGENESICRGSLNKPVCINVNAEDMNNCGTCAWKCEEHVGANMKAMSCLNGKCQYECLEGYTNCGSAEMPNCVFTESMATNPLYCGGCSTACGGAQKCVDGACVAQEECEGAAVCSSFSCQNADTSCGANCVDCSKLMNSAEAFCVEGGTCKIQTCKEGYHLNANASECVKNSSLSCAEPNSSVLSNCNALTSVGVNAYDCNQKGICQILDCAYGYEFNVDRTLCFLRGDCCSSITKISEASCKVGKCVISSCREGYHILVGQSGASDACVENTARFCAPPNVREIKDCMDGNVQSASCSIQGNCRIAACTNENCGDGIIKFASSCDEDGKCVGITCEKDYLLCGAEKKCLKLEGVQASECENCAQTCANGQTCYLNGEVLSCKDA